MALINIAAEGSRLATRLYINGPLTTPAVPYAIYTVEKFCRRTRRVLDTPATGLTHAAAAVLAESLRVSDAANEALWGYGLRTMPLHEQGGVSQRPSVALVRTATEPVRQAA